MQAPEPLQDRLLRHLFGIGLGPQNRICGVVHPAFDRRNEFVVPLMIPSQNLSDELSLLRDDAIILGFPNQGILHSQPRRAVPPLVGTSESSPLVGFTTCREVSDFPMRRMMCRISRNLGTSPRF